MVEDIVKSKMFRFSVVGGLGILVNVIVTEIFVTLGLHLVIAAAVGSAVSVISNFLLLEHWTFHDRSYGRLWHRFAGFAGIGVVDYAIRAPMLIVLGMFMPTAVANLVTIITAFGVRYALSSRVVWRATPNVTSPIG